MRFKTLTFILAACSAGMPLLAGTGDLAEKGREILNKNQHAIVTVPVVLKLSSGGGGGQSREYKQEITGTVVDPSGLTVVALSACDPTEMSRRVSPENKMESEVTDVKILLDDGTELSSEIVLRDKDLDLAFLRPKTKPSSPMTALDLSKSGTAQVLEDVITLNRLNKAVSRAYAASTEQISAVVQKPRTFYVPDSGLSTTTLGCPAFLPDGKLVGIFVMRAVSGGSGNYRENLSSIILPAEDVLKAAKQAPEAKVDSEKKEESRTPESGSEKK